MGARNDEPRSARPPREDLPGPCGDRAPPLAPVLAEEVVVPAGVRGRAGAWARAPPRAAPGSRDSRLGPRAHGVPLTDARRTPATSGEAPIPTVDRHTALLDPPLWRFSYFSASIDARQAPIGAFCLGQGEGRDEPDAGCGGSRLPRPRRSCSPPPARRSGLDATASATSRPTAPPLISRTRCPQAPLPLGAAAVADAARTALAAERAEDRPRVVSAGLARRRARAVHGAREEARLLRHGATGVEHLLLALARNQLPFAELDHERLQIRAIALRTAGPRPCRRPGAARNEPGEGRRREPAQHSG